ncbi:pyridoxamine 5'-phosphate oxidase family protein [Haloarcula onubensis]|uniref:Pyridoxamine 5'-phosphate oxidase family protein n=1 Tax=Haloarcula onubensis TaxID=2950539 RepID=A0ABU2FQ63_9EURY|nr:pyridoxamine 5'-phosphate oxidase family protein [Halomicroarcula sp. S3CR25-11]MDS0282897.1 pyridoxamine 5'-phosphate oxidase family protein [Halomicroarcula sp. S3CR25-11]
MTEDPYAQWTGEPMAEADVEALLGVADHGVLGLADGDEPYTIPVSFGYDDGDVFFAFVRAGPDSEKGEFIADGKTARLLVTDIRARFDWQSVAVTGPVESVNLTDANWSRLVDALTENPWFSTAFDDDERVEGVQGWRLVPETVTGLEVRPETA